MTEKPRFLKNETDRAKEQAKFISPADRLKILEQGLEKIDREHLIEELDKVLTLCMEQKENFAALMNCKNILELLKDESDKKIKSKYINYIR